MIVDPYIDPTTGVMHNKLGITSKEGLRVAEYFATYHRSNVLLRTPIKGDFDLEHLCAIHKYLFQDVYEWAGELRTVNMSKGQFSFARVVSLESDMTEIHSKLLTENFLRDLDKEQFVEKFTEIYRDLNALHPFRDGNARATREFIGQLAREAGYTLDQKQIEEKKNEWHRAAANTVFGVMGKMEGIFREAIHPNRPVGIEHEENKS